MNKKITNVLIVGGGDESIGLLRSLVALKNFQVVGLVCDDETMPGSEAAKEVKVEIIPDLKALANREKIDVAIETSGSAAYLKTLKEIFPPETIVIDKETGFIIFNLARECERLLKIESIYKLSERYSQIMEESNKGLDEKILELGLLNDASRLFSASLDPRNVSAQVYNIINKKLNMEASCVFLLKEDGEEMIISSNLTLAEDFINKVKEKLADLAFTELGRRIHRDRVPVITCHGEKFEAAGPKVEGLFQSFYSAPLVVGSKHFGYFGLVNRAPDTFRKEDIKFFITLANQMAMFIESDYIKNQIIAVNTDLKKRGDDLTRMNEALTKLNKELDDFTYTVSHDLKEPLRGIEAFGKFLLEDYGSKLDKKGKEYIKSMSEASQKMKSLIEGLLELSRIAREERAFTPVNVLKILDEVKKNLNFSLKEKKIDLKVAEDLPTIKGNELRITQVFNNLISNAIKFIDKPKPVIEVGWKDGPNEFTFYVKDNGMGIDKKDYNRIFQIFQKTHEPKKGEGTGAGLTICKKIVEEHKGKIWVESEVGKGSTFYFTLPKPSPS